MGEVGLRRAHETGSDRLARNSGASSNAKVAALGTLLSEHASALRSYVAARFGPGPPEPEDVVQRAFAKMANVPNAEQVHDLRAFLYATACNFVIDQRRHTARRMAAHSDSRLAIFSKACCAR